MEINQLVSYLLATQYYPRPLKSNAKQKKSPGWWDLKQTRNGMGGGGVRARYERLMRTANLLDVQSKNRLEK